MFDQDLKYIMSAQITEKTTFTQIIAILTSLEYPETPP